MPGTRHRILADQVTRFVAVATVSGLAALAGWISYHHMLLLAHQSGHSGIDAHAFPLTVDGLDLIGVLVLLADRRTGRRSGWLPWTVLGIGAVASIAANVAVAPDNVIARAISGWSAVALLAAAKLLAHLFEPAQPNVTVEPQLPATTPDQQPTVIDADGGSHTTNRTAPQPERRASDIARRVPTGEATLTRWRRIWQATKHLDAATADTAAAHGVSLRTLQFVRAAGEQGHLDPPDHRPVADTTGQAAAPGERH